MKFKVKRKNIKNGKRNCSETCPIALAVRSAKSFAWDVCVNCMKITINGIPYKLPKKATKFMDRLDRGVKRKYLKPFSFKLNLTKEL